MHETLIGLIAGEPLSPVSPGTQSLALQNLVVGPVKEHGDKLCLRRIILAGSSLRFSQVYSTNQFEGSLVSGYNKTDLNNQRKQNASV